MFDLPIPNQVARIVGVLAVAVTASCSPSIPFCSQAENPLPAVEAPKPEYTLVVFNGGGESSKAPEREVKDTQRYRELRANPRGIKSVAIRLPNRCLDDEASKVAGVSNNTQSIFQTTCGPWLSEIEKALAGAGYQVYSWDALNKLEKEKGLSTYNAGKLLGADVVFVLNSLEASDLVGAASAEATYKYFESDKAGSNLGPKPLDDQTRLGMRSLISSVLPATAKAQGITALSSIIDATAVLSESGESIWFYRRVVTFPLKRSSGMRFLFGRSGADPWKPVSPVRAVLAPTVEAPRNLSTEDRVEDAVGASNDQHKSERLQLIRTGAQEFVTSFRDPKP